MPASIICVNNVCSISLRAVENALLLMPSIRVKKFLHTSPFFLIQGINQDSRICCFQKISCSISIKLTLYIVANIVTVCQYDRCFHNNYVLSVCLCQTQIQNILFVVCYWWSIVRFFSQTCLSWRVRWDLPKLPLIFDLFLP
jgi:hypothetical protein